MWTLIRDDIEIYFMALDEQDVEQRYHVALDKR